MGMILISVALLADGEVVAEEWKRLTSLPDREGFASAFAGVGGRALLVAGGANFPDAKPWDGGAKVWYDNVFVLERPDGAWTKACKPPRPSDYGVSVTHRGGEVCVGGGDASWSYADSFRLDWKNGRLLTTPHPAPPKPRANASGAPVGDVLYIVGGQEGPDSQTTSNAAWTIDLSSPAPRWRAGSRGCSELRRRVLAVGRRRSRRRRGGEDRTPVFEGRLSTRPPRRLAADRRPPQSPGRRPVAGADGRDRLLDLGGDDGSQVGGAPESHRDFSKRILHYAATSDQWTEAGAVAAPRVTASCVLWNKMWIVPSDEARPGVRPPEVWAATPESNESMNT